MDVESFRGVERLLVVAVGALAIYLGYRLFLDMPLRDAAAGTGEGEGKVKLPGGISIYISRVGPGVFFALFGAIVIALSFHYPLIIERAGQAPAPASVTTFRQSYFDGAVSPEQVEALRLARLRVRDHIGFLNGLPAVLRGDLSDSEGRAIESRLRNAKLDMIEAVWGNWGDLARFRDWVRGGAAGTPPAGLEEPAALYRHRQTGQTP